MPDAAKVNELFAKKILANTVAGNEVARKKMMELDIKSKWELIKAQKQQKKDSAKDVKSQAKFWVNKLQVEADLKAMIQLRLCLGSKLVEWVKEFCELGGSEELVKILDSLQKKPEEEKSSKDNRRMQHECIECFSKIMNNPAGLEIVIHRTTGVNVLMIALGSKALHSKDRITVLKLLTVVFHMPPDGHGVGIAAINHFKKHKKEKARFKTILEQLRKADKNDLKVGYMALINAVINVPQDLDLRISLRKEFFELKFKEILAALRQVKYEDSPELDTQVKIFDDEDEHDTAELTKRYAHLREGVNLDDINAVFEELRLVTKEQGLSSYFHAILKDLIGLPFGKETANQRMVLAERLVKQISYQTKLVEGSTTINLGDLLTNVQGETKDLLPLKQKIDDLEDKSSQLEKKSQNKRN